VISEFIIVDLGVVGSHLAVINTAIALISILTIVIITKMELLSHVIPHTAALLSFTVLGLGIALWAKRISYSFVYTHEFVSNFILCIVTFSFATMIYICFTILIFYVLCIFLMTLRRRLNVDMTARSCNLWISLFTATGLAMRIITPMLRKA
jgi:hypothetical protein